MRQLFKKFLREIKILFQSPKMFYYRYFRCIIPNSILWIKKNISINLKWHKIIFPNEAWVQWVLMETFMRDIFKDMHWLDKVLDIWWFIGESAVYLSTYNKEVYVYELSPTNYNYLVNNCKWIKNIRYFNWCIWNSKDEYIDFSDTWNVSSINRKWQSNWNNIKIKNYNIIDLLKNDNFDWLKLDIEWWEYDILKPIIDAWLFKFKKWIIEFHDLNKREYKEYYNNFYNFLVINEYNTKIYDNEWKKLGKNNNTNSCNIFFEKTE